MMACSTGGTLVLLLLVPFIPGSDGGLDFLTSMLSLTDPDSCPPGDIRCESGECILKNFRCDSQIDCKDGSDEAHCPPPICTAREFMCDKVRCLPIDYRCDGQEDCKDKTDELLETCLKPCPEDSFRCSEGKCIPIHWKCDKEKDCKSGEDEAETVCQRECPKNQWSCRTGVQCISAYRRCDGTPDCADRSDELTSECQPVNVTSKCNGTDFRCADGKCIPERWVCDGNRDCPTSEDEQLPECMNSGAGVTLLEEKRISADACLSGDYTCANGDCIPKTWHCDGSADCEDESDEKQCSGRFASDKLEFLNDICNHGQVACSTKNSSWDCLPLEKLCDKRVDCNDGADEGGNCLSACLKDNGQCSHTCNPTPLGPVCTCPTGFMLSGDRKACAEIDYCTIGGSLSGPCGHYCHSMRGGFKCTCAQGFHLESDSRTCKPIGPAFIAYAVDSDIKWFGLHSPDNGVLISGHPSQMKAGLDFCDTNGTSKVFFTDTVHQEILQSMGNPPNEKTILDKMSLPEGLAYDWMAENLYYADSEKPEIGVCSVGGKDFHCTVLISQEHLDSPRGIAVHPGMQYLFFSQWKKVSVIERVLLDGTSRKEIVSKKVVWPNSLTIDYIHNRIYWLDAHNKWIESSTFDGTDRRIVIHMKQDHPYSLTILGNRLYWSDWFFFSISSVLTNGSQLQVARKTGKSRPMALVAIHDSRQISLNSPCQRVNGISRCEHLCLARSAVSFVCVCSSGYYLVDSFKCVRETHNISSQRAIVKSTGLEHIRTEHPCRSSADCTCTGPDTSPHDSCVCMANRCHLITSKPMNQRQQARALPRSGVAASSIQHEEPSSSSTLAGIVCASILFVIIIVIVIFLFRKYYIIPANDHDEKSLLDADPESPVKKPVRCPSVLGGFTNPVYENVTPNYMVRFYKTRRSCSSERGPDTPVAGCTA